MALLASCGAPEFTPWQSDLPDKMKHSTRRNLDKINLIEGKLPFTIGLLGDPQGTPGELKKIVDELNKHKVEFNLILGDLTDFGLKDEFIDTYNALERFDAPYLTVIGNHDALAMGKKLYAEMFGPFDYTFFFAGIKFVMWNTNKYEFGTANLEYISREAIKGSVIASHIPPIVDIHTKNEVDRWLDIYKTADILTSMHGHRGTTSSFRDKFEDLEIYTVAKVSGVHFALVRFNEDLTVQYIDCNGTCNAPF